MESSIPEDFDSIPVMNPQLSVFVWRRDIYTGIQPIWDLYTSLFENNFDNEKFSNHFNIVRNQRGIKWTLTMALFWIRPYDFMPLDSNSREYLQNMGITVFDEKDLNAKNYLDLCKLIKEKISNNEIKEKSIPEISYNAWLKESQGDNEMQNEFENQLNKYKTLLENNRNLILHGAPGTGKTHLAKEIAKAMECEDDNIGFVQFHPSYDYTDFVEGLRPTDKDGNGNVGFERRDGVFKEFCARALKNLVDSRKTSNLEISNFDEVFENFIAEIEENQLELKTLKQHKDFYLRVGPQKTIYAIPKTDTGTNMGLSKDKIKIYLETGEILDWKPYLTAIGKYIEEHYELQKNEIKPEKKNFVFIIDEINRGEVAKIFGELFYSVDPGYRFTSDDLDAIKNGNKTVTTIKTQYANLETEGNEFDKALCATDYGNFFIPENVYIIGTMNDIDRSVESMDFAMRRRFSWVEVKTSDTVGMLYPFTNENGETTGLESKELADEAKRRMDNLNAAISEIAGLNEAYYIGASYFLNLKNYEGCQDVRFKNLWEYHLKGILTEYLRGNPNGKLEDLKVAYDREE